MDELVELCDIPEGWFMMGDEGGRPDERPQHRVWTRAIKMARLPVTNAGYARFLAATGHPEPRYWNDARFNNPDQPVVAISWFDAQDYCAWLTERAGRPFRLPSEAEWERVARGGTEGASYPWGDDPCGWSDDKRLTAQRQPLPYPVGQSKPNGFGVLDMGYNIHEWCSDWYHPAYYADAPAHDPRGPVEGSRRASRGGAWRHQIQVCRNAARSSLDPTFQYNDYGFRVVCDC